MKSIRVQQRGDTMVEVLIAIAVASFIIGISYALVNRTLNQSQQAQEHSEAIKLAEGQLEQLKSNIPSGTDVFCFKEDGSGVQAFSAGTTALPAAESDYPAACTKFGEGDFFRVGIVHQPNNALTDKDDIYQVSIRWPGPTGNDQEVGLSYRTYK
jgi:type II secretory pathway pseudopilin PulG